MAAGEFFFAWVDPEETTFGPEHERNDAGIISFELSQREGDFASLTIVTRNPKVGILNPGRKRWAWLSWDAGGTDGPEPLFFGRVIGAPEDVRALRMSMTLLARPADYEEVKAALAETLKVAPYWDAIWIDPSSLNDPDLVLQARTANWHIDRVTHEVTISDNVSGEDGLLTYGPGDLLNDTVRVGYSGPATRKVRVKAEVRWTQRATGVIDVAPNLIEAFRLVGTTHPFMISSYSWEGIVSSYPLPGDSIGAGWTVEDADLIEGTGRWIPQFQREAHALLAWVSAETPMDFGIVDPYFGVFDVTAAIGAIAQPIGQQIRAFFHLGVMKPTLTLRYDAERSRSELVAFELAADVQALVTDEGDETVIDIALSSNEVSEPLDPEDADTAPIGDVRRRSYVVTDRGRQSVEYLVARARAELVDHARVVTVEFSLPFANILDLTCRKNARVIDDMLPGGEATGKIVGYTATGDGDTGAFTLRAAIACCVGKGNSVSASDGVPDYVETDYVEDDYQTFTGRAVLLGPGDVTYTDYSAFTPNDDGIDFFDVHAAEMIESLIVTNGPAQQATVLATHYRTMAEVIAAFQPHYTRVCFQMKPMTGGPYDASVPVTVSSLMIPRQIDMEAAAW